MTQTAKRATRFVAGQTIGATQLNRVVDLANELASSPAGSRAIDPLFTTPFDLEIKALGTTAPYTLTCVYPGESANSNAFEWTISTPALFNEPSRDFGGAIGVVNYTYTNINTRTATGGTTETQYVTPPFVVGEVIQVQALNEGAVFAMVPDGRMWAVDPAP